MPTLAGRHFSTPLGRDTPDLIAFRLKKNAVIMFFATCPTAIFARYRDSTRIAVSKST